MCRGTQEDVTQKLKNKLGEDSVGEMICLGRCYENSAFYYDGENYSGDDINQLDNILAGEHKSLPYTMKSYSETSFLVENEVFSSFEDFKELGTYSCAVCGNALFKSNTKFDSGCGWPSFFEPLTKTSIIYLQDNTLGMKRTEVQCGRCESHLGHVFEDGPPPTGLRYCINGVVLDFVPKPAEKK